MRVGFCGVRVVSEGGIDYMVPQVDSEGGMVSELRPMDSEDGVDSVVQPVDSEVRRKGFYSVLCDSEGRMG